MLKDEIITGKCEACELYMNKDNAAKLIMIIALVVMMYTRLKHVL